MIDDQNSPKRIWLIILSIIGFFLIAGGVSAYFFYWQSPENIVKRMVARLAEIQTLEYAGEIETNDSKRLSDLRQIQTALELYFNGNNTYPRETTAVTLGEGGYACLNASGWSAAGCSNPYMGYVPKDPGLFIYSYTSDGTTYLVSATL